MRLPLRGPFPLRKGVPGFTVRPTNLRTAHSRHHHVQDQQIASQPFSVGPAMVIEQKIQQYYLALCLDGETIAETVIKQ